MAQPQVATQGVSQFKELQFWVLVRWLDFNIGFNIGNIGNIGIAN